MRSRIGLVAMLASVTFCVAKPALADGDPRETSRAEFRQGVALAQSGDYAAARDAFMQAYQTFPHPSILLNLGIARAHTGEWVQAEQDLTHFLADDGGAQPDELTSARAELAETRKHIGQFRLRVTPDAAHATFDGKPVALIPGGFVDVRTARGTHDLSVAAEGYELMHKPVIVDAETAPDVDLALVRMPTPTTGGRTVFGTVGWILVGTGVAVAGLGLFAGIEAQSAANAYNSEGGSSYQSASTKSRGLMYETLANVSFIGAGVLGATGVVFVLLPSHTSNAQARVIVGPSFSGVTGSF